MSEPPQNISFSGNDNENTIEVSAKDVIITTSAGKHDHGSSRIKLKNIVDFSWENRLYSGQLLAVHKGGKFVAYGIKVPKAANPGTSNGMVRVAHRCADKRALLKGMCGQVQDIAFAHIESQAILASIDEEGTLFIHDIGLKDNGIVHQLLLQISNNSGGPGSEYRVVWCPYIPDEDEDVDDVSSEDEGSQLLVTTHGNKACVWNVSRLTARYGAGPHNASSIDELTLTIAEHAAPVLDAAFSPDGTALATASLDGYVMFFQVKVYLHNENSPRCLHKWQPHDGKPLSCLFFLDNHKGHNDEQFWKFAVTGTKQNTILKVWSCKSWTCLQTLTFAPSLDAEISGNFGLKAGLDPSANYLLLSDVKRRALYILQMTRDSDDSKAYCKTISEFLLPYPVVSFGIIDAGLQSFKCPSSCADPYHSAISSQGSESPINNSHENDNDDLLNGQTENGNVIESCNIKTVIRLYLVQPNSLQEGRLTYETPHCSDRHPFNFTNVTDSHSYTDGLTDVSRDIEDDHDDAHPDVGKNHLNISLPLKEIASSEMDNILAQQSQQLKSLILRSQVTNNIICGSRPDSPPQKKELNLMTPDAFSAVHIAPPVAKNEDDDPPLTRSAESTPLPPPGVPPLPPAPSLSTAVLSVSESDDLELADADFSPVRVELPHTPQQQAIPMADLPLHSYTVFGEGLLHNKPKPVVETVWPSINMAKINEANQRKASSEKAAHKSKNNSINVSSELETSVAEVQNNRIPAEQERSAGVLSLSADDKATLKLLTFKLGRLFDLMAEQKDELRAEMAALHHAQGVLAAKNTQPAELIEESLQKQYDQFKNLLEENLTSRWEETSNAAAASSARAASAGIARALEPLVQALQRELAAKLTATDSLLRDNINKLVTSKSVTDCLKSAITQSLNSMLKDSLTEVIQTNLIPAMEKTQIQIFKQINQTFQNGVKEFITATELAARGAVERGTQSASSQLQLALEQHTKSIKQISLTTPAPPPLPATAITDAIKNVLEHEFSRWNEKLSDTVDMPRSSRTVSPNVAAQRVDPQAQQSRVNQLLSTGQINCAFQYALNASDLRLVIYACKIADINKVFSPCQLQQNVLLSLMQQLSADLTADTALKEKYLQDAVMNIDMKNPVTREHLPVVVQEIQHQFEVFLTANPAHPYFKQLKILSWAIENLIKS